MAQVETASGDDEEVESATVEIWYDHEPMFEMDEYLEPDETVELEIQEAKRYLKHTPERGRDTYLASDNPDAVMERYHFRVQTPRSVKLLVHHCRSAYDEWSDTRLVENGLRYEPDQEDIQPFGCQLNGRVILNVIEWDGER